jgi:hypothetical protein
MMRMTGRTTEGLLQRLATLTGTVVLVLLIPLAAVGQTNPVDSSVAPATSTAAVSDRTIYTQKAQRDAAVWQQKLQSFSAAAHADGRQDLSAAETDLSAAWAKSETQRHKLETAGEADWVSAKAEYEVASRELANAWDRYRSEAR